MIDFSGISSSGFFQLPQPFHFGVSFEPSACIAIGVLFAINSIQAIGDLSATTVGSMDREPTTKELQGGIVMYGIENIIGAVFGGLPTATYSQNVGIVTTTKVINPLCSGTCRSCPDHCRTGTEIFCTPYHHSSVRSWRCHDFRIRFYRYDGDQADHAAGNELSKYFYCRSLRSSWNGALHRLPDPSVLFLMGDYDFRFITGCSGYYCGYSFKCHSSQRRKIQASHKGAQDK